MTSRPLATFALVAAAAIAASGCGDSATPESTSSEPAAPEPVPLELVRELPDGPAFIEGSVGFVEIQTSDGEIVEGDELIGGPAASTEPLIRSLAPGKYRVIHREYACQGSCPDDPASIRDTEQVAQECEASVDVADDSDVRVIASIRPGGCELTTRVMQASAG